MNIFDLINANFANITSPVYVGGELTADKDTRYGFTIVGADSPQYLTESDRQRNEGQEYRRAANKGDVPKLDAETAEGQAVIQARVQANLTAIALAVTTGWFGFTDASGATVPYSSDLAAAMFAKKRAWRDAVIAAIDEDKRFLPQPVKG